MNHKSRNHESGILEWVSFICAMGQNRLFMVFLGSGNPRESICWSVSYSL